MSQRNEGDQKLHRCAVFNRLVSPAEANYNVGNLELQAVGSAVQEWHHWLEGATLLFVVWTDHKSLVYLHSTKRLNF